MVWSSCRGQVFSFLLSSFCCGGAHLEAEAVIAGFDNMAMMRQAIERRGRHFCVAEHAGPFAEALSRCRIEHVTDLLVRQAHAAATTSFHVCIADALKARCVLAEVRWRWTLKMLWAAACTERNLCADPALLKPCILRSRSSGRLMRILRSIVAPSTTLVALRDPEIMGCGSIRSEVICDELVWDKAIFLQKLTHQFECRPLVSPGLDPFGH